MYEPMHQQNILDLSCNSCFRN